MRSSIAAFPVVTGCLTAILAAAIASSATAQAQVQPRLAALPLNLPRRPTIRPRRNASRSAGCCSGIRSCRARKTSRARPATIPTFGYSDGLDLSIGANGVGLGAARAFARGHPPRLVKRNSQTVLNVAFNGLDASGGAAAGGRADVLGSQGARASRRRRWSRSRRSRKCAATRIRRTVRVRGRRRAAERHPGIPPAVRARVRRRQRRSPSSNLGRALAAFQRTLVAANTPFDRYMRGDTTAHDSRAGSRHGSGSSRSGCINCHSGPMFSDFAAHVLAVPDNPKLPESDAGVNKTYAFRTPSLRNLSATAPYMHNGVFATLARRLNFYRRISRGGGRRGGGGTAAGSTRR